MRKSSDYFMATPVAITAREPTDKAVWERRLQAVAELLKSQSEPGSFHAQRAAVRGERYWFELAASGINHPGVALTRIE